MRTTALLMLVAWLGTAGQPEVWRVEDDKGNVYIGTVYKETDTILTLQLSETGRKKTFQRDRIQMRPERASERQQRFTDRGYVTINNINVPTSEADLVARAQALADEMAEEREAETANPSMSAPGAAQPVSVEAPGFFTRRGAQALVIVGALLAAGLVARFTLFA